MLQHSASPKMLAGDTQRRRRWRRRPRATRRAPWALMQARALLANGPSAPQPLCSHQIDGLVLKGACIEASERGRPIPALSIEHAGRSESSRHKQGCLVSCLFIALVLRQDGPARFRAQRITINTFLDKPVAKGGPRGARTTPRQTRGRRKQGCLLYTSPSPRDGLLSRMPSSA